MTIDYTDASHACRLGAEEDDSLALSSTKTSGRTTINLKFLFPRQKGKHTNTQREKKKIR